MLFLQELSVLQKSTQKSTHIYIYIYIHKHTHITHYTTMFGPFKASGTLLGGLLWKVPWRLSAAQKLRQRQRLRDVDGVVEQLTLGLHAARCEARQVGLQEAVAIPQRARFRPRSKMLRLFNKAAFFPREEQMAAKNKYTVFDKKARGYRKGIHRVPKWTKVSSPRLTKFH